MFCRHCGKEVDNSAFVCPNCGYLLGDNINISHNKQSCSNTHNADSMSIGAMICAFLIPLVGLILSIISLNNHKNDLDTDPSKKLAKSAFIISIIFMVLGLIISILLIIFYSFFFASLFSTI